MVTAQSQPQSKETEQYNVIGTRPIRHDGVDKVTGAAQYGADISLPGMLAGRVLRSPHAHARIVSIDTSKAEALEGVLAVITNADFPRASDEVIDTGEGTAQLNWVLDNVIASDKVLYKGHAVAAVAATDHHIAEDAVELIEVEYDVLTPVLDVRDAMVDGSPLLHDSLHTGEMDGSKSDNASNTASHLQFTKGDLDAGFADADVVIEREFETSMAHQGYIEPHNGTAYYRADGTLDIYTSTQGAFVVRDSVAPLLQLSPSQVKVTPMEIGGGFGGKIPVYLEPLAALLSQRTGRPVKLTMNREEVLLATGPTSGTYMRVRMGAKRDGTITAADVHLAFEAGAYPGSPVGAGAMCALAPYDIPNQRIDGYDVVVNKPKTAAYRAPGAPQSEFATESVLNELAEELGLDPLEMRLQNACEEGAQRADGFTYGIIGNVDCLQAAKESPHWQSELEGPNRGRGIAQGFWFNIGFESSAYAQVNGDGSVPLVLGSTDIGGTRASIAMQLAETLGISAEDVHPHVVDTNSVGYTQVTGGSRTTFAGGWAAYECAMDIRRQMEERAAQIWECDASDVSYGDDAIIRGPADEDGNDQQFTFKELAAQLVTSGGHIVGRADVNKTSSGPAFATHIVDVEVDPDTGKVDVLRYTAVQDAGTAIHPAYVEGQMQGGVAQGVGMALNEEYYYDDSGDLKNASLLDYRMPTALDLPMIDSIIVEVPNPGHPYGVRGVGEVPIIPPAPAVRAAIANAIGVHMNELPMSPRAILDATVLGGD